MASNHTSNRRHAALLVAFMWGAYFLNYGDRQAVFAMFSVLKEDLALSDTTLGLLGSVFLWTYGLACPLAGFLADRYSKRLLVVLSLAVWSAVTIATGFAGSAIILVGLRAAMGLSEALYMPAAIALTANAHPPESRSRAVSTLTTAQIVGTVGGGWFGGWMAQHGYWREAFFVLGAIGLLYAIPYFMFLRTVQEVRPTDITKKSQSRSFFTLFRVPTFNILCIVFPIFVFGLWLLYGWLPSFFRDKFSLGLADAAFAANAPMQCGTLIGLISGGVVADKLFLITKGARLWLMTASLLLCAPCIYMIGAASTLSSACTVAAGFGLFGGFFMGNIFPSSFEVVADNSRASAVGFLNFFGALVSGFAPLMGGMWKESLGIEGLLAYTALAYILAAILLVICISKYFARDYASIH